MRTLSCKEFFHIDKENRTKLEAKSKKCTFTRYGVDDFGYHLWDYENHKIIRIRDVVFNEKFMYKDQLQGKKEEKENTQYTVLDEIKENEEQQEEPQTAASVRRYTKLSRHPERFSPSLYFY